MQNKFIIIFFVLIISSCRQNKFQDKRTDKDSSFSSVQNNDSIKPGGIDTSYAGYYNDLTICSDCPDVDNNLTLEKDGSYVRSYNHFGFFGKWRIAGDSILVLREDSKTGTQSYVDTFRIKYDCISDLNTYCLIYVNTSRGNYPVSFWGFWKAK